MSAINNAKNSGRRTAKQRRASRTNGQKSRGPVTTEGKANSRQNALKHGLTSIGTVLPPEHEALVEQRLAEWEPDFQPQGAFQHYLLRRAVVASVQLDAAEEFEAAGRAQRIATLPDHDPDTLRRDAYAIARHPAFNRASVPQLQQTAVGCEVLIELWDEMAQRLLQNRDRGWNDIERRRFLDLLQEADRNAFGRPTAYSNHLHRLGELACGASPEAVEFGRQRFNDEPFDVDQYNALVQSAPTGCVAFLELMQLILDQINDLQSKAYAIEANAETTQQIERAQTAIDTSKTGELVRRYQNSASSELFKMVRQIRQEQALKAKQGQERNEPGAAVQWTQGLDGQEACVDDSEPESGPSSPISESTTQAIDAFEALAEAEPVLPPQNHPPMTPPEASSS